MRRKGGENSDLVKCVWILSMRIQRASVVGAAAKRVVVVTGHRAGAPAI